MRGRKRRSFDFGNFEITKREILVSVSIVAIMLLIGVLNAGKISDYQLDKNEKYNKAIKIESQELFEYGMRTNAGNAFVYGDLKAVDTVTYPEIGGEYIYIEKVKERYTMHTRQVAHTTTMNGKTHTYYTTETYWTWDYAGSEERICDEISFLNHVFSVSKIDLPGKEKFVMIDLHVEGYCQECAGFQPCIERLYADGKIIAQTVYCENRERCANIYEFAHEKVGKEIGKDD